MVKFYISEIISDNYCDPEFHKKGERVMGLFRPFTPKTRGNFFSQSGHEEFCDTELYAYFSMKEIVESHILQRRIRTSEIKVCNPPIKCQGVSVQSWYLTEQVEAESLEEAIDLFGSLQWEPLIMPKASSSNGEEIVATLSHLAKM